MNGLYTPAGSARPKASGAHVPAIAPRSFADQLRIWWREVDKWLLTLIVLLMALGMVAVAAASPAGGRQYDVSEFYFFQRHIVFGAMGFGLMLAVSFVSVENARRIGIVTAIVMIGLLFLVPLIGVEVNGARRWLKLGIRLQPSEFLKPGFAILLSWILSWRVRDASLPVLTYASLVLVLVAALLMMQPNLGATILFCGVWFVLVMLSGISLQRVGMLIAGGITAFGLAYLFYGNARTRIDAWLSGGTSFDQVDLAQRTLLSGGWTGSGLWLGRRKMSLPEAHTDYIFSVIGEEFGLLMCGLVLALYLAIIVRVLIRLVDEDNLFVLLAGAGLATQIGGQAFINMAVNLQLFPSKGMTLPLVSYGGSSTLAVCFSIGLLLAITRRNPFLEREKPGLRTLFAGQAKGGTHSASWSGAAKEDRA